MLWRGLYGHLNVMLRDRWGVTRIMKILWVPSGIIDNFLSEFHAHITGNIMPTGTFGCTKWQSSKEISNLINDCRAQMRVVGIDMQPAESSVQVILADENS